MIGFGRSIRVAQCLVCLRLNHSNANECEHCHAVFPEQRTIRKFKLPRADELVEPFIWCPACQRTLKSGAVSCPECGERITRQHARSSIVANVTVTQSCIAAEHIQSFNPAAFIMLAVTVYVLITAHLTETSTYLFVLAVPLAVSVISVFSIVRWFRRFPADEFREGDSISARRKVTHALWLWLVVLIIETIALILAPK